MEKNTIKEMYGRFPKGRYGTDGFPELFCGIGAILRLKKDMISHMIMGYLLICAETLLLR